MPEPWLQLLSFPVALLAGLVVKVIYYSIPAVSRCWQRWLFASDPTQPEPDFALAVLLSLPFSGAAAILVNFGIDQSLYLLPFVVVLIKVLPQYGEGYRQYLARMKHWKLELLSGTGVAVPMVAAFYAAHTVIFTKLH